MTFRLTPPPIVLDLPPWPIPRATPSEQLPDPLEVFYGDDDGGDEHGDDDDAEFECGQMPDGTCFLAGSEWCDWDCPYSR